MAVQSTTGGRLFPVRSLRTEGAPGPGADAPKVQRRTPALLGFDGRSTFEEAGVSSVLALDAVAPAQGSSVPPRIQALAEDLDDVMLKNADRVWPNASWETRQVVFVDTQAQRAWLWNDQSRPASDRAVTEAYLGVAASDAAAPEPAIGQGAPT